MKKNLFLISIILLGFSISGCATWDGVKKDSNNAWSSTKKAVHEASE